MTDKEFILNRIQDAGIVAVLRGPSLDLTLKMVAALVEGGVIGIEITFTTPDALSVVQSLDKKFGDQIILGMGTVTTADQAVAAKDAGATFLVSPHTEKILATAMSKTGLPFMMGALSPSEVIKASNLGSDVVKLFPGSLGGPGYLKALKGPFPDLLLMPTGGVSKDNLNEWFAAGAFAVGAGSNLCPKDLAIAGEFDQITQIAGEFINAIKKTRY